MSLKKASHAVASSVTQEAASTDWSSLRVPWVDNVIKKLHQVLKPFMLRRIKSDVEKDLPPKKEIKLFIGMTQMQKDVYKK